MLEGETFTFIMMPNPKKEVSKSVLIFLTTLPNAQKSAELYAKRWKIECLFKHLKINGYNLEDLNRKDTNKNLLMMALVTLASTLAIRKGWKCRKTIWDQKYQDGTETREI